MVKLTRIIPGILPFLTCFLLGLAPFSVFSQDNCNKDRLLLVSSVSSLKNSNLLEIVKNESKKDFKVKKDLKKVKLLVLDTDPSRKNKYIFEPYNKKTDSCEKVKVSQRKKRFHKSRKEIVRRVQCSCDFEVKLHDTNPNDTFYNLLYGMDIYYGLHMPEAWDLHTGDASTVVGVIDTGIDYTHPDLAQNIWTNTAETPGNNIDDDANGYIDDIHGYDFADNDSDPMDELRQGTSAGHGTHVAGTIGGVGNNSTGVAGVNWSVSMMALKTFPSAGTSGSYSDSAEALNYVAMMYDRGVNIVATNNSYGGGTVAAVGPILASSLSAQESRGIIYVASAGNSALNMDNGSPNNLIAPAAIASDIILSVAATTSTGELANYSNYGAASVDVAAPGSSVASTYPNNQYVYMSGTSMAAPHVTGLVAFLAGYDSNLSWSQIKERIITTGVYNANLTGKVLHPQIVNGNNVIRNIVPATPTATNTPLATSTSTPSNTPTHTATSTATLTPSSTPVEVNTPVPTSVTQPTIVPTSVSTSLPVTSDSYKMQGKVFLSGGFKKSRSVTLRDLKAKISIVGSNKKVAKEIALSNSGSWRTELKPGKYTIRVVNNERSYKAAPASIMLDLDSDLSLVNFTITKR